MKKNIIKLGAFVLSLSILFTFGTIVLAQDLGYQPLVPLPGIADTSQSVNLGAYLASLFKFGVGLCALFAVVMIVIGGFEYVMTESIASKEEAKSRITNALGGLLLALVAVTLLYTINPALVGQQTNTPAAGSTTP